MFLFGQDETPATALCDILGLQGRQITLIVDNVVGEGTTIATLYDAENTNSAITQACYSIQSISDTAIVGKLSLDGGDGNVVSGKFEVTICP